MKKIITIFILFISIPCLAQQKFPLQITVEGYILLTASANDTVSGSFVLDTGGGLELISEKFFNKIKKTATEYGVFTCFRSNGERIDLILYQIPSLQIGNYKITNAVVGIFPMLDQLEIDGLISCKFFEKQPFSIDYPNQTLIIESLNSIKTREENSERIPIFVQQHGKIGIDIFIDICLNEEMKLLVEFDTGNGYNQSLINSYFKNKMKIDTTITKMNVCLTESITEMNPKVEFKERLIFDGLIGSKLFSSGILTIDIPSQQMMFRK